MQFDRGYTNDEVEEAIAAYYRRPDNATAALTPLDTDTWPIANKAAQLVVLAWGDALVCVAVFAALCAAAAAQRRVAESSEVHVNTITDYSVHVTRVPQTATGEQARGSRPVLPHVPCAARPTNYRSATAPETFITSSRMQRYDLTKLRVCAGGGVLRGARGARCKAVHAARLPPARGARPRAARRQARR